MDASRSLEEGITITKKAKKKRDQLSKWPLGVINLFYSDIHQQKGRSRSIKEVRTAEKAIPIEKKKQYFLTILVFIQIVKYIHSWFGLLVLNYSGSPQRSQISPFSRLTERHLRVFYLNVIRGHQRG